MRGAKRLMQAVQAAGLAATAWVVWVESVKPRAGRESLWMILGNAVSYVLLAWLASTVITFYIYLVVSLENPRRLIRISVASSGAGMWFAPAMILLSSPSPPMAVAGLLLVVNCTRLLFLQWTSIDPGLKRPAAVQEIPAMFGWTGTAAAGLLQWPPPPALIGALAFQTGLAALLRLYPIVAGACFATGAAIVTSLAMANGVYEAGKAPNLPKSMWSLVLTFLLAATISVGGIRAGSGSPSVAVPGLERKRLITTVYSPSGQAVAIGNHLPGVILWPAIQPQTRLVAPLPSLHGLIGTALRVPASVEFSGEYWMYQPPWTHPPEGSFEQRGSPAELAFRTTDGTPLAMEARQKFDPAIDLGCCSKIQLEIRNADSFPVTLELTLMDGEQAAILGVAMTGVAVAKGDPFRETLNYPIPASFPLRKFGEIRVAFRRVELRSSRSARTAIERLVLVPKGA